VHKTVRGLIRKGDDSTTVEILVEAGGIVKGMTGAIAHTCMGMPSFSAVPIRQAAKLPPAILEHPRSSLL
jgi:hypothetical protein